jgi:release factor family 2
VDLGFLRPLYERPGNYVSVYLDTSRAHENAPEEVALRWRAARENLARAGADTATLDAAEEVLTSAEHSAPGRAVFARGGAVAFTAPLGAPPRRQIARVAPLPHVMPLLAQHPPAAPHLRVVASRAGGEILTDAGDGAVWPQSLGRRQWPVHKVSTGGWSQARLQRSAEEAWEENAKELASAVTEAARRTRAEHIIIGGDVRARTLLRDHLTAPFQPMAVFVDREVPADSPGMAQAAREAISARVERTCRERFGQWLAARERAAAVEGLDGTIAPLREGRVSDLFVADRPTSTTAVWTGPGGTELAVSDAELRDRGVARPVSDRADAAIVRALATTGGELHFLPEDLIGTPEVMPPRGQVAFPRDGICATLRWAEGG